TLLAPMANTLAYKCQYFFVPDAHQPDRFRCRLIGEDGYYTCSRVGKPLKAGTSSHPTLGLYMHLRTSHGISGQDLINEDEFIHKSTSGKTIQTINFTCPLVSSILF